MDALKKAEQEKREAAKKLKSPDQEPSLSGGYESPEDTETRPGPGTDVTGPHPEPEPGPMPPGKSLLDLSLEPMEHRQVLPPPAQTATSPRRPSRS